MIRLSLFVLRELSLKLYLKDFPSPSFRMLMSPYMREIRELNRQFAELRGQIEQQSILMTAVKKEPNNRGEESAAEGDDEVRRNVYRQSPTFVLYFMLPKQLMRVWRIMQNTIKAENVEFRIKISCLLSAL